MNDQLWKQFKDQFVSVHYKVGDRAGFARGYLRRVLDGHWQIVPSAEAEGSDVIKSITIQADSIFKIEELDHDGYAKAAAEDREVEALIKKTQQDQVRAQARQMERARSMQKEAGAKPKLDLTPPIVIPGKDQG